MRFEFDFEKFLYEFEWVGLVIWLILFVIFSFVFGLIFYIIACIFEVGVRYVCWGLLLGFLVSTGVILYHIIKECSPGEWFKLEFKGYCDFCGVKKYKEDLYFLGETVVGLSIECCGVCRLKVLRRLKK